MFTERTSVGLDVHARSVVASALDTVTSEVVEGRLIPDSEVVTEWLRQVPGPWAAQQLGQVQRVAGVGLDRSPGGLINFDDATTSHRIPAAFNDRKNPKPVGPAS